METKQSPEQAQTNFREVKAGKIAAGLLYRSGHPFRDGGIALGALAEKAGIECVLNLADEKIDPDQIPIDAAWYDDLAGKKKIICLGMDMVNIPNPSFDKKLKRGLRFMIANSGPYLIHCFAGVDRTGFVIAVLEALTGAALEEIFYDYSLSYDGGGFESTGIIFCFERGDSRINRLLLKNLETMNKGAPVSDENIQSAAERYLWEDVGLFKEEILRMKNILSGVKR